MEADLIIFRLNETSFVEVSIIDSRVETEGRIFMVPPGDGYLQLNYSQVVFAKKLNVDNSDLIVGGSQEISRYTVYDENDQLAIIKDLRADFSTVINGLIADQEESCGPSVDLLSPENLI